MNQGRIWCVVSPTVGLPLFLGSVALTSLAVHYCVLSNTTWMSSFFQGAAPAKTSALETAKPLASNGSAGNEAFTITVAPASATDGAAQSFTITVTPKPADSTGKSVSADSPPGKVKLAAAAAN
jgi:light-harvesting protein B-800-850 alpha chain